MLLKTVNYKNVKEGVQYLIQRDDGTYFVSEYNDGSFDDNETMSWVFPRQARKIYRIPTAYRKKK